MQDIAFIMNQNGLFVWDFDEKKGDLNVIDGFETACLATIFTNSRLDESQVSPPIGRSGWVGNIQNAVEPRELGGKAWSLENQKVTTYLLTQLKEAVSRAFDWMLKDKIARNINVSCSFVYDRIDVVVRITARDGAAYETILTWKNTNAFTNSINQNTRG